MTNIAISYRNLVDAAATILTASSYAGNLGIQNVVDPRIGRRWRAVSTTPYVTVDFGSNVEIDVVSLVFPRDVALPLGTVRHYFDADGGTAGAGAAFDSGVISLHADEGYGYHTYFPASTVTARYWRFAFDLSAGSFIDVGRVWAGSVWTPIDNIDLGWGEQWGDISAITQSRRSGAEFVDARPRQRGFSFGWSAMAAEDKAIAQEVQRIVGTSNQIFCVVDPDNAPRLSILGRMGSINPITQPHNAPRFATAMNIRESI